jgi:branched-chain amino acid transport system substrate-binding protein
MEEHAMTEITKKNCDRGQSRRGALKLVGGALAAPALLRVLPANAQSAAIKIGFVSPKTGPIAAFSESNDFTLAQVMKAIGPGISNNGKIYPIHVISKDSQSSSNRAAEAASELILGEVDLLIAASTPDTTNPVADQAEANEVPCITTLTPWQPYFFGRKGDPKKGFDWTYHFSGVWRTSSPRIRRSGTLSQRTKSSAVYFPTTPTATPGAIPTSGSRGR